MGIDIPLIKISLDLDLAKHAPCKEFKRNSRIRVLRNVLVRIEDKLTVGHVHTLPYEDPLVCG